jgi:hypothetical protein
LLILGVRLFLVYDFIPEKWKVRTEFHGWDEWATEIKEAIPFETVVFDNTYQNAAKFEFYSGLNTICLTNQRGRMNQYDVWQSESLIQGEDVTFLPWINNEELPAIETSLGRFPYIGIEDYQTFPGITLNLDKSEALLEPGKSLLLNVTIERDSNRIDRPFLSNSFAELVVVSFDEENRLTSYPAGHRVTEEMIEASKTIELELSPPGPGKHAIYFTLTNHEFPPTVHSMPVIVTVAE